eukprot:14813097-Alexandrium_andersonii.AAC.1
MLALLGSIRYSVRSVPGVHVIEYPPDESDDGFAELRIARVRFAARVAPSPPARPPAFSSSPPDARAAVKGQRQRGNAALS